MADEPEPRPTIYRLCELCKVTREDHDNNKVIVSPRGMAHFGADYGRTECGKDATGDKWWWPL